MLTINSDAKLKDLLEFPLFIYIQGNGLRKT